MIDCMGSELGAILPHPPRMLLKTSLLHLTIGLLDPLIHQFCHPVPDTLAVLQCGAVDLPIIQATLANVSEKFGSAGKQHVVGQDYRSFPEQTGTFQHLQHHHINKYTSRLARAELHLIIL